MRETQATGTRAGHGPRRCPSALLQAGCAIVLVVVLGAVSMALHAPGAPGKAAVASAAELAPLGTVSDRPYVAEPGVDVDLVMVGDVLMHEGVYQSGATADGGYDFDHVFAHVKGDLDGADLKILNQETPLGGDVAPFSGYPQFNGPQQMGDSEARAGFNVVLKASNHAMDAGYAAIGSELGFWRRCHPGVAVVGMRDPDGPATDAPNGVWVYEKDGYELPSALVYMVFHVLPSTVSSTTNRPL